MKTILPNVWRVRLAETDWDFSRCPSDEADICLWWELHREKTQAESGGTLPPGLKGQPTRMELRRRKWQVQDDRDRLPKGWILHPHFPQFSYLDHRHKERWKRIERIGRQTWPWLDVDWFSLVRHRRDWLEGMLKGTCVPSSPLLDGPIEIVPMAIPWDWRDKDILEAFKQWLKQKRRVDEPPPMPRDKGGAGSPIRQVKRKLKALAAWRLIQHYNGHNFAAFGHCGAEKYLGRQFANPAAWSKARALVLKLMEQHPLGGGVRWYI